MKQWIYAVCILSLVLAGCTSSTESPPPSSVVGIPTNTPAATVATGTFAPSPTAVPVNPAFSPTPDLRLPPERWQDWPIIPEISARAREIYQHGLSLGNDPQAFSKVGDCQNTPEAFLGIYDLPGRYSFAPEYQFLQETVDYYAGSFNRQGESVRGGFNASSVLLPLWANAEVCLPGESPVQCENRIHNPSIAIISLEVWFAGRTPDVYENYMRQIIEYNIAQGTLPVLSTKADNVEGDHSINYTVAKLAYEYDLPLWNYWLAVQSLPNRGLDPTDPTGFHLSVDGWNMRSFTALLSLDTIRRRMADLPLAGAAEGQPTPSSSGPAASFTPGPVSGLPYGQIEPSVAATSPAPSILLSLSTRNGENLESAGIFRGSLNGTDWQALAEEGLTLLDYSASGILASRGSQLYLLKDDQRSLLTDQLHPTSARPALWLKDGRVAAILRMDAKDQVAVLDPAGIGAAMLPTASQPALELYPSPDPARVYWGAGTCSNSECMVREIQVSASDGSSTRALPYTGQPAFAPDGKMAFMAYDAEHKNQLTLVNADQSFTFNVPGNRLVDLSWSPDGSTLALGTSLVSNYSGRVLESWLFFITWPTGLDIVLDITDEVAERHIWSPDGKSILQVRRKIEGGTYRLKLVVIDTASQKELPTPGFRLLSADYLFLQPIFWQP